MMVELVNAVARECDGRARRGKGGQSKPIEHIRWTVSAIAKALDKPVLEIVGDGVLGTGFCVSTFILGRLTH
jgi:hypothetical protein